jgi:hypothetical protein
VTTHPCGKWLLVAGVYWVVDMVVVTPVLTVPPKMDTEAACALSEAAASTTAGAKTVRVFLLSGIVNP